MKALMRFATLLVLVALVACATTSAGGSRLTESADLWDASRDRHIPIAVYFPARPHDCIRDRPCPVALLSPGYGLRHTDYSFVANTLARSGYLVVAIQHDLPTDAPLSRSGDLFASRMPAWHRGVENLHFVRDTLSRTHTGFDWSRLTLVGHSNGGDISALFVHQSPALATALVTLDHRRYPLPRSRSIKVLSIRGSDFEADPGVLPTAQEANAGTCIRAIAGARHNDMNDHGPTELQSRIGTLISQFLDDGRCGPPGQVQKTGALAVPCSGKPTAAFGH